MTTPVKIPGDRQVWDGKIATYWWEGDILVSNSKSVLRTVELISDNVKLVKEITNNRPVPLLIYLANSPVPDKATRQYSAEKLPEIYSAMAMVAKPGLASLIMTIVFRFKSPPIPIKNFSNDKEALNWLRDLPKKN
jgi:hypothetical protein